MEIYIDGEWHDRDGAKISVFDHGLLYGDGVFEGIRVYGRRVFRLREHLDRLYASAQAIALRIPPSIEEMTAIVNEAVRRNRRDDVYIRLIVTRGVGSLGIDPSSCPRPSVIVIVADVSVYPPDLYAAGIRVVTSATRQVRPDVFDPRIKSLNYLKNVLAKIDAHEAGAHEAVMLNAEGFVAECTADNIFLVKEGTLLTPPAQDGGLAGITRGCVLELASSLGVPAAERRLARYDLYTADECFVTGTGAEIMHVRQIDGRTIGNGESGATTHRLRAAFRELARSEGVPVWND